MRARDGAARRQRDAGTLAHLCMSGKGAQDGGTKQRFSSLGLLCRRRGAPSLPPSLPPSLLLSAIFAPARPLTSASGTDCAKMIQLFCPQHRAAGPIHSPTQPNVCHRSAGPHKRPLYCQLVSPRCAPGAFPPRNQPDEHRSCLLFFGLCARDCAVFFSKFWQMYTVPISYP